MRLTALLSMLMVAVPADFSAVQVTRLRAAGFAEQGECGKAQTAVEKMVCADAGLRELDEHLGRYSAAAADAVGSGASCVRIGQAEWLKRTRGACRDAACLRTAYLNRLAELDPLQPGVTAIKTVELPRVPALVWVIGPAEDKVAAPANPKATPFEAEGTIANELAGGDGFLLRTADGAALPIVLDMFLEGETHQRLSLLAKAPRAVYRVRGYIASDGAKRFFEPSRCTFIYRR